MAESLISALLDQFLSITAQQATQQLKLVTGVDEASVDNITSQLHAIKAITASDTITSSKFIKDPEVIISKSGVFRLRFFSFANSTNRYVGICYNQIPVQTVIWVANRNNPLKDSSGTVTISDDGNLVVLNGQQEIVWSSGVTDSVDNTRAQLLDSGNLVLSGNSSGVSLWESFQYPSNAFMPTMKIGTDGKTETIIWKNNQIYFRSGPWNGQTFIGLTLMNTVYLDGFYLVADDQEKTYYFTYDFSNKSMLYYELDSQGNIVQRSWDAGKVNWENMYPILENNDCDVYGKCGAFGSCDSTKSPICSCLRGFEPKNIEEWNRGNWTSGCVRTTPLSCQKAKGDGFLKLERMKVPAFPERSSVVNGNCDDQCLKNCSCMAYAYDVSIGCMFWSGDLIDIQKFPIKGVDLYIRLASSEFGN
ncbi:hypothetical protein PTKIN_Ptkin14bG0128900 [Pterospermum kingtungense]